MRRALFVSILAVLGACGDDGGSSGQVDASTDGSTGDASTTDAAIDAPAGAFTLTSPTITMGMPFPIPHICDGANTSPALNWSNAPAGTMSFAIIFTDNTNPLIHSIIYDIPAAATGLPANVMKAYLPNIVGTAAGAKQTRAYDNNTYGYLGPCPPPANAAHTYEFKLYAMNLATLPGTMMTITRPNARTLIEANDISSVSLTATADR
jgi:Raf kinase inhibitor-like YbhB/YbcL family protein